MTSINANQLVNVLPQVLAAGGSNLVMSGMLLTTSTRIPIGTVQQFTSVAAVQAYMGSASAEAALAPFYFNGFDGSTQKPAVWLMAQFPYSAAVAAYERGGTFGNTVFASSGITAVTAGAGTFTIDGAAFPVSGVNLSGATSYTSAASTFQTALQAAQPTSASATGSTISATTFTVGTIVSGTFAVGQVISGTGVTANTILTALLTGTGGSGSTFTVSISQTTASTTITGKPQLPTVTFDSTAAAFVITSGSTGAASTIAYPTSLTGSLGSALLLTQALGAVLSQGAAQITGSAIPAALTAVAAVNGNWASFTTGFEPSTTDKLQFASWVNSNLLYWYSMWDSLTASAYTVAGDTTSAGYQINQLGYTGTSCIGYDPSYSNATALLDTAVAATGFGASINYNQTNGRQTWAYRSQAGLAYTVANSTVSANMLANGYCFYGDYANQANAFIFFQNGSVSGSWKWLDSYTNQIWMNNGLQTALIQLLQNIGNVPYNAAGYALIRSALYSGTQATTGQPQTAPVGPIAAALNFGAIRSGVILSSAQITSINNAVGAALNAPAAIYQNGWYLSVKDPGPTVRAARGSPLCTFYYTDGQSVQTITLTSINIQ